MDKGKNFGDSLADEILTEVADGFLGIRKEIDEQVARFESCVSQLAQKAKHVRNRAALLNYLLLKKDIAEGFYQSLDPEARAFSEIPGRICGDALFREIPFALGLKKKYGRFVVKAYEGLFGILKEYLSGRDDFTDFEKEPGIPACEPNYRMVLIMAELINEKIKKINKEKSPSTVLRFAKSLNPQLLEDEKITGAVSPDYESLLNKNLELKPILVEQLPIKGFPELPATDTVRLKIIRFCANLYPSHKTDIARRVSVVAKDIRSGRN